MQKKFILLAVCLSFSIISLPQFQKGSFTANFNIGDIRYTGIHNKAFDKQNDISFNPGFGYFIKNNWEIGVGLNFRSIHISDSSHGGSYQNSRTYGLNIYTNYYFGKGKLKPYLTFKTGWNHSEGKGFFYGNPPVSFNSSKFYYEIGGGLNWNISSRFSLFTEATFVRTSPFNHYGYGRLNLTVGARFFFNRKRR